MVRVWLCLFAMSHLCLMPLAHAEESTPEQAALSRLMNALKTTKTLGDTFAKLKDQVSAKEYGDLIAKIKGHESDPMPRVTKRGANLFTVEFGGMMIPVEIMPGQKGLFKVNHKQVALSPEVPFETRWKAINAALPASKSSAFSLIEPPAQAEFAAAIIVGTIILAIGAMVTVDVVCEHYKTAVNACRTEISRFSGVDLTNVTQVRLDAEKDIIRRKFAEAKSYLEGPLNCSAGGEMQSCLDIYIRDVILKMNWNPARDGQPPQPAVTQPTGAAPR